MSEESNYEFDRDRWCKQFPLSRLRAESDQHGMPHEVGNITSPVDLISVLQIREQDERFSNPTETAPCDVFVFAYGEPADRNVTKIGGLPYRPAHIPWPKQHGKAYTFVGQVNFTKSRDMVGSTPADVLLVFADSNEFQDVKFEWYALGIENLIHHEDIPVQSFECVTCFGIRHRTFDLPESGHDGLAVLNATKIGGVPVFEAMSGDPGETDFEVIRDINHLIPGQYLCSLSSVQANPLFEFPWTNHEPRLSFDDPDAENYYSSAANSLIFFDLGRMLVLEPENGDTNWWVTSN